MASEWIKSQVRTWRTSSPFIWLLPLSIHAALTLLVTILDCDCSGGRQLCVSAWETCVTAWHMSHGCMISHCLERLLLCSQHPSTSPPDRPPAASYLLSSTLMAKGAVNQRQCWPTPTQARTPHTRFTQGEHVTQGVGKRGTKGIRDCDTGCQTPPSIFPCTDVCMFASTHSKENKMNNICIYIYIHQKQAYTHTLWNIFTFPDKLIRGHMHWLSDINSIMSDMPSFKVR